MSRESERINTEIHRIGEEKLLSCRILKEFNFLLQDRGFFRIHHSHIINLHHLWHSVRVKGGYVVMSDGRQLEVSIRRKEEFMTCLGG